MTEETTGEVPEVEANALATNEDAQVSESSTEDNGEADHETGDDQETDERKVPDGVQQRINEITRKRREAERRAERAERKLKERESRNLDDLDYDDQVAERTLTRSKREQIEEDREAARELAAEAYQARVEAVAAKYPDYNQVAHFGWEPSPAMIEVIMDSDLGPDLAYHLGKNPAEAARIAALNPISQVRELGKIEAAIAAPKTTPKPPPEPVRKVGSKAAGTAKDPSKMTMAEYVAYRASGGG